MANYETIYIIHPDVTDDNLTALNDKLKDVITNNGGTLLNFEDWGKRKLAYRVKKQVKGHYILVNYSGSVEPLNELERIIKVSDDVIKYFSVKLTKNEMARLEKKLAARKKAAEPAPPKAPEAEATPAETTPAEPAPATTDAN